MKKGYCRKDVGKSEMKKEGIYNRDGKVWMMGR